MVHYKVLLFHQQAVGENCFCATGAHEPGDSGRHMGEKNEQIRHGIAR